CPRSDRSPMTAKARRSPLLAVLVSVVVLLGGCHADSSTPVDEARLEVLRAEARAVDAQETRAVAGWQESDRLAPVRGHVHATVADISTPDAVPVAREEAEHAITALRASGWTVYLVACVPPRSDDDVIDDGAVLPPPAFDTWSFVAYGYKIIDEVSYFVMVSGSGMPDRDKALVTLRLLAPYSGETAADLFPDRPAATGVGASC